MINVYSTNDTRFSEIVKDKLVYFSKNYNEAYELIDGNQSLLYVLENDNSLAYKVMIKRNIMIEGFEDYVDLISPYGYGGWIIEGKYDSTLFDEYKKYCFDNKIVCEFERFDLLRADVSKYYGEIRKVSSNVVKDVSVTLEEMFANFERRVQKNIRKAKKNGLVVSIDEGSVYLYEFMKIYYSTMERNNADSIFYYSKEYFDLLLESGAKLFHVFYENKIISTELVLYDDLCSYSFLGGTLEEFFHLRPTEILKYEIMKWSHDIGLNYFVLGGGYGHDDGIFNYKKGLAPNGIYNFYVGSYIFNQGIYDLLCESKEQLSDDSFFPAYRK